MRPAIVGRLSRRFARLTERFSVRSEFSSEITAGEMRTKVREMVRLTRQFSVKAAIGRVGAALRKAGLEISDSRVEDYYQGEVRRPPGHEVDAIRIVHPDFCRNAGATLIEDGQRIVALHGGEAGARSD